MTTMAQPDVAPEPGDDRDAYDVLIDRLNDLSVTKHFDAYADIDWDDAHGRRPTDPTGSCTRRIRWAGPPGTRRWRRSSARGWAATWWPAR